MKLRSEIKEDAKGYLRNNYLPMVGAGLVLSFVIGELSRSTTRPGYEQGSGISISIGPFHYYTSQISGGIAMFLLIAGLAVLVFGIMVDIFVMNPLVYSGNSWFRHNTDGTEQGRLTSIFGSDDYSRIVKIMLWRDIRVILYFFLLIIPGIIKSYAYYFVPQLAEDHPEMNHTEILALSEEMTMGRKMELFIFDLSFFGWYLLSGITFGLSGIAFSFPYRHMARQLLYLDWVENGLDPAYESRQV